MTTRRQKAGLASLWCGALALTAPPLAAAVFILAVGDYPSQAKEAACVYMLLGLFAVLELGALGLGWLGRRTTFGKAGLCLLGMGFAFFVGAVGAIVGFGLMH